MVNKTAPMFATPVIKHGIVTSIEYMSGRIGTFPHQGVHIVATDALSYLLSRIKPKLETQDNASIQQTFDEIFRSRLELAPFHVKVQPWDAELLTPVQLNFDGNSSLEDVLNNFAHTQDCMWTVIDDVLLIGKSISRKFPYIKLDRRILGYPVITPVWFYNKNTSQGEVIHFIKTENKGGITLSEFVHHELRPGDAVEFNTIGGEGLYQGAGHALITSMERRYMGACFTDLEGMLLERYKMTNHPFRQLMDVGVVNGVKYNFIRDQKITHSHNIHPAFMVGQVLPGGSGGVYNVRLGQEITNRGRSRALYATMTNSPRVLKNVPLSSLFSEVGADSPYLPANTKVLVGFNNNDINDPIIIGILQTKSNLPCIKTEANGTITIKGAGENSYIELNPASGIITVQGDSIKLGIAAIDALAKALHTHTLSATNVMPGPLALAVLPCQSNTTKTVAQ